MKAINSMDKATVSASDSASNVMTQASKEIAEEIVLKLSGQFFEVDGSPMTTVKYDKDGVELFKRKVLLPTLNFTPAYTYLGKSNNVIIGMSPEDPQEYDFAELSPKDLDIAFPLFGSAVAKVFGKESENFVVVLKEVIADKMAEHANKEVVERDESLAVLQKNELYGMF